MNFLLVLSAIFLGFSSIQTSALLHSGKGLMDVYQDKEYECKPFPFDPAMSSDDVRVQLSVKEGYYNTAVTWVESVTRQGFTACVATSGLITARRIISLQWMAFENSDLPGVGFAKVQDIPLWTTGTKCVLVDTGSKFSSEMSSPFVFLTVIHTSPPKNKHDATSVWAEEVTKYNFKACVRELKNFDGAHSGVKVEILALANIPSGWSIPDGRKLEFSNDYFPSGDTGYSFCRDFTFAKQFYEVPVVITTARHVKGSVDADDNAITEWVHQVSTSGLDICVRDIQRYDAFHDPITVNFLAIGSLDPCQDYSCSYYAVCSASTPTTPTCVCQPCHNHQVQPICDVFGVTYQCRCEYKLAVCKAQKSIPTRHLGGCKPFVFERGRVILRLNTTDVQCKTVSFKKAPFESGRGSVYVQTSINFFNCSGDFIHDAAVTWVENVNINTFEVCALKAGRAERLTPDGGLTFVDFVAFQECPVGAIAGRLQMPSNWWDGTTCKTVAFEKPFSDVPYILLTAEHKVLGQKHDAATVWVENAEISGFTACSREMQNFDGLHENITLNWIAFNSLPSELSAKQKFVDFPNSDLPKAGYHNAYCEDVKFAKTYSSTPTVIVSAYHSSGIGYMQNMKPEYNSIAPWVEHINTTDCRVCIKEIHKPNGYDPVKVATMMIGE